MFPPPADEFWTKFLRGITDFLVQADIAKIGATCVSWNQAQKKLGLYQNLSFNGNPRAGDALQLASTNEALCRSVRRMSFEFCNKLENYDLVPIEKFTKLEELNLNACRNLTDSSIEIISERCPNLRRIDLFWDVVLTDISINALANAPFTANLAHLNLSGLKHITDDATVPLIRRCPLLTFLDLTRCEGLRDETFKAIGATCNQLRTLLLYATPNITDVGFEALAPGVPHLTHLDITGMKLITDRSIVALARHCTQMRVLHLMWVTPLTDASLRAMGQSFNQLDLLSIHGNIHMTESGIESLAKGCRKIQTLDVNGCKNIGKFRMNKEELQKIFPKLQHLTVL